MISLARFHTFRLPAHASSCLRLISQQQIPLLQSHLKSGKSIIILGEGSNSVFLADKPALAVLVRLSGCRKTHESAEHVWLRVRAGVRWNKFAWWTCQQGWWGLENLVEIPGYVGAAPIQNIGAYGVEVSQVIESVCGVDLTTGLPWQYSQSQCRFGYRDSVFKSGGKANFLITEIVFRLSKIPQAQLNYPDLHCLQDSVGGLTPIDIAEHVRSTRAKKLPSTHIIGNAGSFFKNPIISEEQSARLICQYPNMPWFNLADKRVKLSAGWMIDQCGLKGYTIGAMGVSPLHALVLTHDWKSKRSDRSALNDLKALIALVQKRVYASFSIHLEPEPLIYT